MKLTKEELMQVVEVREYRGKTTDMWINDLRDNYRFKLNNDFSYTCKREGYNIISDKEFLDTILEVAKKYNMNILSTHTY